ncbi:MAG: hypothetical protein QW156_05020 [Candidatus Aenigmatarchaeota archaeon]
MSTGWTLTKVIVGGLAVLEGIKALSQQKKPPLQKSTLTVIRKPCNCPQDKLRFKVR